MLKALKKAGYGSFAPIFPGARIIPLHVMISGCGYSLEMSQSYSWDGLKRGSNEFCIFQCTLSGCGCLDWEGRVHDLPPGTAFMVHVPHAHRYYLPPASDSWGFIYFSLVGREALALWRSIEKISGPVAKIAENSSLIRRLAEIYCGGRHGIRSAYEASALGYELLMLLCEEVLPRSHLSKEPEFIERVISHCMDHIGDDISVEAMASVAGLSRFHFSRLFRRSQGVSPGAFLINLRMKQALRLIQTEALSVKEISGICGFKDPSYFCKVFRRYFEESPEKFRKGKADEG